VALPPRRGAPPRDDRRRARPDRAPPPLGGRPAEAEPWLLEGGAAGGHPRRVRRRTGRRRAAAGPPAGHVEALVLRAEVLDALGDGGAPDAYAAAAAATGRPGDQDLIARKAQAQLKASLVTEAVATLEGVTPYGTAGRLAQALTLSAAAAVGVYGSAEAAQACRGGPPLALELGDPGAILDAHVGQRARRARRRALPERAARVPAPHRARCPEIATRVFDGQLCVTERMLHGGLPNAEIIAFADGLAAEAERLGAARGQAFAMTLRGEAGLLRGDLEQADHDFAEGARLHGRIGALAGEALSLLGRAQVATAQGRAAYARPFLADALLVARESEVGHHTLDRIYGAMVEAAADPGSGLALLREAEGAIQGPAETCPTCRIAFTVPATIAAARGGDLERAHRYQADVRAAIAHIALPPAWHAAAEEAHGWVARAQGDAAAAARCFAAAGEGFDRWGQPLDAERCRARAREDVPA
jgi:hypothetical protein